ncbi:alpha-N-arabinofuranosidase [Ruania halotolerans]|uniref:arabinosylfuranosidase ArfA n=1 Tax=Ruania halotolerans TaxID=2897773 RepID=UPI001E303E65|nr:alpha-N-arabinofuranosidase [Ruania halotolerans]UFU07797.1 alpha-N-arabinofuranosidase [Ruania halotolerans]
MANARITLDPAFTVGPVRRRTFGSFVEHLGRAVYTGIHEPDHPTADADGFRQDVIDLTRELGVSTVRYPGGNFVSGYRWEDGIGPIEQRPTRLDLAWHSSDPNHVGVDEFLKWSKASGTEPMMAVNLGTRGVQEALDLLEYCNVAGGTHLSDLRRKNGAEDPYRIRMWCLGNEMDGPWQIGHKTAEEYGRLAAETARAMRMIDPELELVACGSSGSGMPTFGEWERIVLTEAYEHVDYVSAHAYYYEEDGDLASFLACAVDMDHFIDSVAATADAVGAARKLTKKIHISFDEWNVWYQKRAESRPPTGDDWPVAPVLLEDHYNVADAVVVGNLLISLLRHTDRVHAASQAQLVNVIAPIMTEPGGRSWKQTIFHPFALTSKHAAGEVLELAIDAPVHETAKFGEVSALDAVATRDGASGEVAVFVVNRSTTEALTLDVDVSSLGNLRIVEAVTLANPDHTWQATPEDDSSVAPEPNDSATLSDGQLRAELPPVSWSMLRLATA